LTILLFLCIFIILNDANKWNNQKLFNNLHIIQKNLIMIRNNPNILIKKYNQFFIELPHYNHTHIRSKKIFWFWFQGEKKAPNLSKACLKSIFKYCKSHEIIIINKKNINKYAHFPPFILNKLKKNYISITHFSDLLRLELLIKYGGTWIDSTVLITKYKDNLFNNDLFFFKIINSKYYAGSNWFITAEKENPVLKITRDLLYEYWAKNDGLFDYFIFHYFFKMAFDKYHEDYKNMPVYLSIPAHVLQSLLFNHFNEKKYIDIIKKSPVHKLTYKKETNITKGLYYHYIIDKFNKLKII
jgi:hypothetical protein